MIQNNQEFRRLILIVIYLTLACFTYEFGIICCLFLMLFITLNKRTQLENPKDNLKALSLLIPILIYSYVNYVDYTFSLANKFFHSPIVGQNGFVVLSILNKFLSTIFRTVLLEWIPYLIQILPGERFSLEGWDWESISRTSANFGGVILNLILVLLLAWVLIFFLVTRITRRKNFLSVVQDRPGIIPIPQIRNVGFLSGIIVVSQVFLIVLRSSMHEMSGYQTMSLYNFYISNLFLTVIGYCLYVIYVQDKKQGRRFAETLVILILGFSCVLNGIKTYQMNVFLKEKLSSWILYISRMENFVNTHKREKNFSYNFVWRQRIRPITLSIEDSSYGKKVTVELSDSLFRRYIREDQPKYYLLYFDSEGILSFGDKEMAYGFLYQKQEKERKQYVFHENSLIYLLYSFLPQNWAKR